MERKDESAEWRRGEEMRSGERKRTGVKEKKEIRGTGRRCWDKERKKEEWSVGQREKDMSKKGWREGLKGGK